MIRRRWRGLIVPTLLGTAAAGATVGLREPVYRSSALLLIEVLSPPANELERGRAGTERGAVTTQNPTRTSVPISVEVTWISNAFVWARIATFRPLPRNSPSSVQLLGLIIEARRTSLS